MHAQAVSLFFSPFHHSNSRLFRFAALAASSFILPFAFLHFLKPAVDASFGITYSFIMMLAAFPIRGSEYLHLRIGSLMGIPSFDSYLVELRSKRVFFIDVTSIFLAVNGTRGWRLKDTCMLGELLTKHEEHPSFHPASLRNRTRLSSPTHTGGLSAWRPRRVGHRAVERDGRSRSGLKYTTVLIRLLCSENPRNWDAKA